MWHPQNAHVGHWRPWNDFLEHLEQNMICFSDFRGPKMPNTEKKNSYIFVCSKHHKKSFGVSNDINLHFGGPKTEKKYLPPFLCSKCKRKDIWVFPITKICQSLKEKNTPTIFYANDFGVYWEQNFSLLPVTYKQSWKDKTNSDALDFNVLQTKKVCSTIIWRYAWSWRYTICFHPVIDLKCHTKKYGD